MEVNEIIECLNHYLDDEIYTPKCVEAHTKAILALKAIEKIKDGGTYRYCADGIFEVEADVWASIGDKIID